jgi:hypothetical protein
MGQASTVLVLKQINHKPLIGYLEIRLDFLCSFGAIQNAHSYCFASAQAKEFNLAIGFVFQLLLQR